MTESESAKTLFFEALALIDSCDFPQAELRLREALKLAPENVSVLNNLSVALIQQRKRGEARAYAEKAIVIDPASIQALLVLADCHAHDENFQDALAAYDRIIAFDPGIAEVHNNRGLALEQLQRHTDALASYERALAINSGASDAHGNRGNALHQLKRHDEALAAYDKALALSPDRAEAWLGRGNALGELRRHDEALTAYDKALSFKHDLPYAWLGRGNVLGQLRRYKESFAAYDNALALAPDLADAWVGRGNALRDLNQGDALAAYDKALALEPDMAAAWIGHANVFHDRKSYAEALAAYDRALASDPANAAAWLARGNVLRLLKRVQESIESCRHALKCGGDAESIRYHLAALGAEPTPAAMPERFVASLFDGYADNFDKDLVENLKYRMPILLADAIAQYASSHSLDILDMGCGTGLVGERVRPLGRTLTGVDLSPQMLEKARGRKIYDRLVCADLIRFLESQDNAFDLAVAADVFVYLGDLSAVFEAVRRALREDGLFCFSVEAADGVDFVLRGTLRYAQSNDYLRRLAAQHRFKVEKLESQPVRQENGTDIDGYLVVMRCRSS
jgi:predicted TPR repeat methyltransferase